VVAYQQVIRKNALEVVNVLPSKSRRIVIDKCKTLAYDPFSGQGDRDIIIKIKK
jgi:hypothetical protein